MSTPSTVDGPSMDEHEEHEEMDVEELLDSSSSHVHDSSKEGEPDDQTSAKPKRNRKSTQRFLDSIVDDEQHAHKPKKKSKPVKKMDSSSETGTSHNDSGGAAHSDSEMSHNEHNEAGDDSEKATRPRVIPGKVQCTFMESKKKEQNQCKQRAIENYGYCIWHILIDPAAPYKRCEHMRERVEKNGDKSMVQCKTAIRNTQVPALCLAHSEKRPKKKESGPSTSSSSAPSKGSSERARSTHSSTRISTSMAASSSSPSRSSSSLFNLPNEEFANDIDEAIGNMDDLMENFDDFDSILDEDEVKEEDEDEEMEGEKPEAGGRSPLPFDCDELCDYDRDLLDEMLLPIFRIGRKIIARCKAMRDNYEDSRAFWNAAHLHPEAPETVEQYEERYMSERRYDWMEITDERKAEFFRKLAETDTGLAREYDLFHQFILGLLCEQRVLQRAKANNECTPPQPANQYTNGFN